MLPLNDPRWTELTGGYKVPYNPAPVLREMFDRGATQAHWDELWEELHHQGDVGPASYASVPHLAELVRRAARIDFNPLAIFAIIELERTSPTNPPVPAFLSQGYHATIATLPELLAQHPDRCWDEKVFAAAMSCIALARGHRGFARAYLELEPDMLRRWAAHEFDWDDSDPEGRMQLDEFFSRD